MSPLEMIMSCQYPRPARRRSTLLALVALACLSGSAKTLAQNPPDIQVFPQIFHLDPQNTSQIHVQNPEGQLITVTVEFSRRDGNILPGPILNAPALGAAQFSGLFAQPFVGAANVSCTGRCLATASWSFNITGSQSFDVGVLPQLLSRRSTMWAAPVPFIKETASYGFAIHNTSDASTSCSVTFYGTGGQEQGVEEVDIPGNGQVARFAESVGPGFVGGAIVSCDQEVIAVGLIQDTANGFPTSINYTSLP